MDEDTNAVQQGVEDTTPVDSQPTEESHEDTSETPEDQSESDSTSEANVNAESEGSDEPEEEGDADEQPSDRAQQRIRDLSDKVKEKDQQLTQREQELQDKERRIAELEHNINKAQDPNVQAQLQQQKGYDPTAAKLQILEAKQLIGEAKEKNRQDQAEYDRALARHPELDKDSPHYDRKFADLLYYTKQGNPNLTYEQIATELKGVQGRARKQGYADAEEKVKAKQTNSSDPSRRAGPQEESGDEAYRQTAERFSQSGKLDDAVQLLDY